MKLSLAVMDGPSYPVAAVSWGGRLFVTVPTTDGTVWAEMLPESWATSHLAQEILRRMEEVEPSYHYVKEEKTPR